MHEEKTMKKEGSSERSKSNETHQENCRGNKVQQ